MVDLAVSLSPSAEADYLLQQWAVWSLSGGVIPRQLDAVSASWQRDIPSDYPEEPDTHTCHCDDDTMSRVDSAIAALGRTHPRYFVIIVDVYRNGRNYRPDAEDEAISAFMRAYYAN